MTLRPKGMSTWCSEADPALRELTNTETRLGCTMSTPEDGLFPGENVTSGDRSPSPIGHRVAGPQAGRLIGSGSTPTAPGLPASDSRALRFRNLSGAARHRPGRCRQ